MLKTRKTNQKGFTLVELMVGLMVVGLIAALLVGIFGNPLKTASTSKAATQIEDQTRSVLDGANMFYTQKTQEIVSLNDLVDSTKMNPTALTAIPSPPIAASATGTALTYTLDTANATYKGWGDPTKNDTVVHADGITADVCLKIDQDQGVLGPNNTTSDIPAALDTTKQILCWSNGGTYTVVGLVYSH